MSAGEKGNISVSVGEGMDGGEVEGRRFKRSRWEEVQG